MSVFRVERSEGYTVMSNHHLRNKALSLKAKGLLSQMLSLPEDWDYTLAGLAHINREKIDAIREAVKELERAGYIVRSRARDEKGRLRGAEYVIYEKPQKPVLEKPTLENPTLDNPTQENPTLENPTLENPTQENPTQLNKDLSSTDKSSNDSIQSRAAAVLPEPARREASKEVDYRDFIRENIELDALYARHPDDAEILTEMYELLVETVSARRKYTRVAGSDFPHESVKSRLLKLNSEHIRFVLDGLKQNTTQIRNVKQYLLAALFNAPVTFNSKTMLDINHDLQAKE